MSSLRLESLRSRIARRILSLFTLAAVVPVSALTATAGVAVYRELRAQTEHRLERLTDLAEQSILERVFSMRVLLDITAMAAEGAEGTLLLPPGFEGVLALGPGGEVRAQAGDMSVPAPLSPAERAHLARNEALVRTVPVDGRAAPQVLMAVSYPGGGESGAVWARILADSLWSTAETLILDGPVDEMCVLDATGVPHACSRGAVSRLAPYVDVSQRVGLRRIDVGGGRVAAWRQIPLRNSYLSTPWTVAISQSEADILTPGAEFAYYAGILVLIGLSMIVLLTHVLVRRTMKPLEQLIAGTERIAEHDLATRVPVLSDDEFGDLAISFNLMAERLGYQFDQLEAGRSIDQAVLGASDKRAAVRSLLAGLAKIVPSSDRGVFVLEAGSKSAASFYSIAADDSLALDAFAVADTTTALQDVPREAVLAETSAAVPWGLQSRTEGAWTLPVLVLPLVAQGEPFGCVGLASVPGRGFDDEDMARARRLVNQAAVGLNELRLRVELEETSWEALYALANAIDAKSRWTAGHSQRVTDLAMLLGQEIGLSERETDILHRGGLLHDIGKIGVDAAILDFPGRLDAEQRAAIEQHPQIGVDILSPLRAFQPMLPIVLHHHERWDGKGYPAGLAGEAIPRLARLVSVADVFDAMASPRPYREAMDPTVVRDIILKDSGTAFDPEMVQAFEAVIASGWVPVQGEIETFHV